MAKVLPRKRYQMGSIKLSLDSVDLAKVAGFMKEHYQYVSYSGETFDIAGLIVVKNFVGFTSFSMSPQSLCYEGGEPQLMTLTDVEFEYYFLPGE